MNIIAILAFCVVLSGVSEPHSDIVPREAPSRYCGLHCVYAAATILGKNFEFVTIADDDYLSGRYGSSARDLQNALNRVGLSSELHGFVSLDRLQSIDRPAILHVRLPGQSAYSHWVLFLGFDENGKIEIYDPPRETGSISGSDLLAIWDGLAIVVNEAGRKGPISWKTPISHSFIICAISALVILNSFRSSVGGWTVILVSTTILAFGFHLFSPIGFLRSKDALNDIRAAFPNEDIPIISLPEFESMLNQHSCQVVDARTRAAFESFHLPGAENIPIDSGNFMLRRKLSQLNDDQKIIVYCQSDQCGWAKHVAQQIAIRKSLNVAIYSGGVNEWQAVRSPEP